MVTGDTVRLIHDVLIGDRSLFTRPDGLADGWRVAEPLLSAPPPVHDYAPGSWGPTEARELVAPGQWLLGQSAKPRHRRASGRRRRTRRVGRGDRPAHSRSETAICPRRAASGRHVRARCHSGKNKRCCVEHAWPETMSASATRAPFLPGSTSRPARRGERRPSRSPTHPSPDRADARPIVSASCATAGSSVSSAASPAIAARSSNCRSRPYGLPRSTSAK
jgi:Glucose-6-phosphate dehydrogenase, C-terminal domain